MFEQKEFTDIFSLIITDFNISLPYFSTLRKINYLPQS